MGLFLRFFFFFIIIIRGATAIAQFEEYDYFSESEVSEINTSLLIDSEYFSDMLTYRLPLSMHSSFLRSPRVYDLSIGSLSRTRFATQHRLKLDVMLNEKFTFRFAHFEKKDFERNIHHSVLELQYRLSSLFSVAAYTELKSEKKWNDLGAALLIRPTPNHLLRLYTTWIDFSYNKRNEKNEKDLRSAVAYGLVGRIFKDTDITSFFEYYAQVQTPLNRQLESGANYLSRETKLGLRGTHLLSTVEELLHFDISFKDRTEGLQGTVPTDNSWGVWRSEVFDILFQYENSMWLMGVSAAAREWEAHSNKLSTRTYSPHIWYKVTSHETGREQLRFGYEASFHSARGPDEFHTPPDRNRDIEHRGNFRYSFVFSKDATLHLQFTTDLDDFSWEGGNGTFQLFF